MLHNSVAEAWFGTLKEELVHRGRGRPERTARRVDYIECSQPATRRETLGMPVPPVHGPAHEGLVAKVSVARCGAPRRGRDRQALLDVELAQRRRVRAWLSAGREPHVGGCTDASQRRHDRS